MTVVFLILQTFHLDFYDTSLLGLMLKGKSPPQMLINILMRQPATGTEHETTSNWDRTSFEQNCDGLDIGLQ